MTRGEAGEEVETWADHLQMVRCRLVAKSERMAAPDKGFLVATTYTLLLPAGLDVTTADRVSEVVIEDMAVRGPFTIEAMLPRRGKVERFLSLSLEEVN